MALDIHVLWCIVLSFVFVVIESIESKSVFMRSLCWIGVLYFIKQGSPTIIPVRIICTWTRIRLAFLFSGRLQNEKMFFVLLHYILNLTLARAASKQESFRKAIELLDVGLLLSDPKAPSLEDHVGLH